MPVPCAVDQVKHAVTPFWCCEPCKKHCNVYDHRHCGNYLFAASWNVHSLVECVGDARICGVSKIANQNVIFQLIVN